MENKKLSKTIPIKIVHLSAEVYTALDRFLTDQHNGTPNYKRIYPVSIPKIWVHLFFFMAAKSIAQHP